MVKDFKERLKEINTRSIKKIAEAKAKRNEASFIETRKFFKSSRSSRYSNMLYIDGEKIQQFKKLYQKGS